LNKEKRSESNLRLAMDESENCLEGLPGTFPSIIQFILFEGGEKSQKNSWMELKKVKCQ